MNKIYSITPYSFKGNNYIIYGKQNKNVQYLFNKVSDVVKEEKIPATFFNGSEDKIVLTPQTKKAKNTLVETLGKFGIKFTDDTVK